MVDNTVTIVGNLTADPEIRVTDSGATLAEIRIAQNKNKRNADGSWEPGDPMFFQGTVWNDMAENAAASLQKGMRVIIVGKLNYSSWEDRESGATRSKIEIIIDEIGPALKWATTNINSDSTGIDEPMARENYEEDEAPF